MSTAKESVYIYKQTEQQITVLMQFPRLKLKTTTALPVLIT